MARPEKLVYSENCGKLMFSIDRIQKTILFLLMILQTYSSKRRFFCLKNVFIKHKYISFIESLLGFIYILNPGSVIFPRLLLGHL